MCVCVCGLRSDLGKCAVQPRVREHLPTVRALDPRQCAPVPVP